MKLLAYSPTLCLYKEAILSPPTSTVFLHSLPQKYAIEPRFHYFKLMRSDDVLFTSSITTYVRDSLTPGKRNKVSPSNFR